jgi:ribonucleoside-diphosphate reductase alpha chain
MQGIIQRWVDSSISSTVNLPTDVSVETVADIYVTAYQAGLKGITVYREGSREGILVTDKERGAKGAEQVDNQPGGNRPQRGPDFRHAVGQRITSATAQAGPRPAITRVTERSGLGMQPVHHDQRGRSGCARCSPLGKAGAPRPPVGGDVPLDLARAPFGPRPRAIVDQLKGISGPNPVWDNGADPSAPDAIGRAVERHLERRGDLESNGAATVRGGATVDVVVRAAARSEEFQGPGAMPARPMSSCPDCGSPVVNENACLLCKHCGWSKC